MKYYQLTLISKNKKSFDNCLLFLSNNISELNIIKKCFQKKKKKKFLTILKSPHVNKTAQEQFESKLYSKQLSMYSLRNWQLLLFLKKVRTYLFPDVKMKIKFILNKSLLEKTKRNIFSPSNFKLAVFKTIKFKKQIQKNKKGMKIKHYTLNKKLLLINIQYLLKTFDISSELQKIY